GFKIVQETLDRTRVQVVPGPGFGEDVERRIQRGLAARLGEQVRIEVEPVTEIAPEKSGKYRYVVSKVDASEVSCAT
ncbi:MAG: phenylacetate--CoA ligase family protein, partial [Proteobacteria bacterium]|nr:phenylacetate--CoA ligase family protein [Pseudomonadota bacterium]